MSLQAPARPKGKKLQIISTGPWGHGPKAIVFTEQFDDYVGARPVPVPERIAKYHPAVKAFFGRQRVAVRHERTVVRTVRPLLQLTSALLRLSPFHVRLAALWNQE